MSIFGASANDIPCQKKANRNPEFTQPSTFAACDIAAATSKTGPPQARGACLEEI
jgi:hypothetical protein